MAYFLLIETASDVCSVVVAHDENILVKLETAERNHAAALAPLIQQALQQTDLTVQQLSCVAVNGGPGSYTGLRIGLSTAKGLCFASSIPLVMIDSLHAYAQGLLLHRGVSENEIIISTVENRRDELFYAMYDSRLNVLQNVMLTVASDDELKKRLGRNCVVVGSAVEKLRNVYGESDLLRYVDIKPSAINLLKPTLERISAQQCSDLAYSEPFYYKDVYIAPKKL